MTNVDGGSTCVSRDGRRLRSNGLFTRRGRAPIPLSRVILAPDPNQPRHQSAGGWGGAGQSKHIHRCWILALPMKREVNREKNPAHCGASRRRDTRLSLAPAALFDPPSDYNHSSRLTETIYARPVA